MKKSILQTVMYALDHFTLFEDVLWYITRKFKVNDNIGWHWINRVLNLDSSAILLSKKYSPFPLIIN